MRRSWWLARSLFSHSLKRFRAALWRLTSVVPGAYRKLQVRVYVGVWPWPLSQLELFFSLLLLSSGVWTRLLRQPWNEKGRTNLAIRMFAANLRAAYYGSLHVVLNRWQASHFLWHLCVKGCGHVSMRFLKMRVTLPIRYVIKYYRSPLLRNAKERRAALR